MRAITPVKETFGKICVRAGQKNEKINNFDLAQAMLAGKDSEGSFENQVIEAVERGRKSFDGVFFVVVLFKKERLFPNAIRIFYIPRKSCPTSEYDQIVYKYTPKEERIDLIWVVPDKETTKTIHMFKDELNSEDLQLLKFVDDFNSGKLDKLSDKINQELGV